MTLLPAPTVPDDEDVPSTEDMPPLTVMPVYVSTELPAFEIVMVASLLEPTATSPNARLPERAITFVGVDGAVGLEMPDESPPQAKAKSVKTVAIAKRVRGITVTNAKTLAWRKYAVDICARADGDLLECVNHTI